MKYSQMSLLEKALQETDRQLVSSYLIIGKDDYFKKSALQLLLGTAKKEKGTSVKTFDGEDLSLSELNAELDTLPFFSSRSVVLIRDIDKAKKAVWEKLESYLANPTPTLFLLMTASTVRSNSNLYKNGDKKGVIIEQAEEKPWEKEKSTATWLATLATASGKKMNDKACDRLCKQVGTERSLLEQEWEKLICYVGDRTEITSEDIEKICSVFPSSTIWQLQEAIFQCDTASAFTLGKQLLNSGGSIYPLLAQLRTQLQNGFQICATMDSGGTGEDVSRLFPYMKGRILEQNMRLTCGYGALRFKKGLIALQKIDLLSKNSQADHELLIEMLMNQLTQSH